MRKFARGNSQLEQFEIRNPQSTIRNPQSAILGLLAVFLMLSLSQAEAGRLDLVTIPTTKTLSKGDIDIDLELYGKGGIFVRPSLGLTNYLTLGLPINIENLIGRDEVKIELPVPVWARVKLIDGSGFLPTISLGYDPAEYGGNEARGAYLTLSYFLQAKKVSTRSILEVYAPGKDPDFSDLRAAVGLDMLINKRLLFLAEADHIPFHYDRIKDETQVNASLGFFFTPHLLAEIHLIDLREDNPERRVRIEYTKDFF